MNIKIISPAEKVLKEAIDFFEKPENEITIEETRELKNKLENASKLSFMFNVSAMATYSNIIKKDTIDLKETQEKIAEVAKYVENLATARKDNEIDAESFAFQNKVKKEKMKELKAIEEDMQKQLSYYGSIKEDFSYDYKSKTILIIHFHKKAAANLGEEQIVEKTGNGEIVLSSKPIVAKI